MAFDLCPICNTQHSMPCSWMLAVGFIPTEAQLAQIQSQAIALALPSPNGKHDDGEHGHAENDSREPDRFDVENPSQVKCHASLFAAVERQH
jgi:hypothetical protein